MTKFAANLSMLFGEYEFLDRFTASAKEGLKFVEYMFPYDFKATDIKQRLDENNLKQVLFNLPAGNWTQGDRGIAANKERIEEFKKGIDTALEYASILEVNQINCLVGLESPEYSREEQWDVLVNNIRFAAEQLAKEKIILLVEAINTFDIPGFLISSTKDALKIIEDAGKENIKYQYDVYHMQRMEGELTATIKANINKIGHIQIADNPARNQPGTGEINYKFLLNAIDEMGYDGFIGLEYKPVPDTKSSLKWIKELGYEL